MDMTKYERAEAVAEAILGELRDAMDKHAPMQNAHHAYAVILEELDELWDEIKKKSEHRSKVAMRLELRQVAAMALRAIVDLDLDLGR